MKSRPVPLRGVFATFAGCGAGRRRMPVPGTGRGHPGGLRSGRFVSGGTIVVPAGARRFERRNPPPRGGRAPRRVDPRPSTGDGPSLGVVPGGRQSAGPASSGPGRGEALRRAASGNAPSTRVAPPVARTPGAALRALDGIAGNRDARDVEGRRAGGTSCFREPSARRPSPARGTCAPKGARIGQWPDARGCGRGDDDACPAATTTRARRRRRRAPTCRSLASRDAARAPGSRAAGDRGPGCGRRPFRRRRWRARSGCRW